MKSTLKFLTKFVEENVNAVEDALEYIKNRGFLDSFGIDRLSSAGAAEEFAKLIQPFLDYPDEAEAVDSIKKVIFDRLINTRTFNSSSTGANMLSLAELQYAQFLTERIEWWMAVDAQ